MHFLRIAQLVAVGGGTERNENGGTAGGCDFRRGDGSCPANDYVGPGKTFRHVGEEGDDLGVDFAARVGGADSIIVALASLVNDGKIGFAEGEEIHRVHEGAIDGQSSLAAAGN
ncbi:MAG: hypothetical protein ABSH39_23520 [Candidatus Acidiferrum sp.]